MKSKKLVLYSGGQLRKNSELHDQLSLLAGRSRSKMTYMAFCAEGAEGFFLRAVKRYKPFGINVHHMLKVDQQLQTAAIQKALDSEIIYLAGGNTFYFLKHLRNSKMLPKLKKFVDQGGVLAGLSAGAIMMTPNIYLAGYPSHLGDDNEVGLKNLSGLGLVNFEFSPHHVNSAKLNQALTAYSKRTNRPIIASHDGGGVVIDGDQTTFLGRNYLFAKGLRTLIKF